MGEDEARRAVQARGWSFFVDRRDGAWFWRDLKYDTGRINVIVVDGLVTEARVG